MVCAGNGIGSVGGVAVAAALVSANTVLQVHCSVQQLYWRVLQMCCSVLQCIAVCCSVLQFVVVRCSVLQCVAVCCSVCCKVLQCTAECCNVLQCAAGVL